MTSSFWGAGGVCQIMTVDDLGGSGVSQMMTRGEKIDFVCSNRSQMMTVEGG